MTQILVETTNKELVEKLCRFLCIELNVYPTSLTVAPYDIEDGVSGLCMDISDDEFIVFVKEQDRNIVDICTTIAHEMIHVKQFMKENLSDWLNSCGHIPYLERWWEKEAYGNAVPLLEKFAEVLKNEL